MSKKKILLISDDLRSSSGVGCQARYLATGLANTGKYTIRQLGAAIKHPDYSVQQVHPDIVIKPIDGFGTKEMYRQLLATERPDITLIFTDPRFFINLFDVHDEFHQICPIAYWHLWDQCAFPPVYNKNIYDACDLVNCINRPTYEFLQPIYGDKINWVPHGVPKDLFRPLTETDRYLFRKRITDSLRTRDYGKPDPNKEFILFWTNRNAHRKRPSDVIWAFKLFLDRLKAEGKNSSATLLMHTNPDDVEGPKLSHVVELFGLQEHVIFSRTEMPFEEMVKMYNAADSTLNISSAEGFGLSMLESMMCEVPIIALKTGGMERQVVNCFDGTENGVALPVEFQKLVGSQQVPYILEDYVSNQTIADAIYTMYSKTREERKEIGKKAREYALKEFSLESEIQKWDLTIEDCIKNWRSRRPKWSHTKL